MTNTEEQILVLIGSCSWDTVARPLKELLPKSDLPGKVANRTGGVIFNVASHIAKKSEFQNHILLFSSVGSDTEGEKIISQVRKLGISTEGIIKNYLSSDKFIGIEDKSGNLHLAISDFSCTNNSEAEILKLIKSNKSVLDKNIQKNILIDGNFSQDTILKLIDDTSLCNGTFNFISVSSPKSQKLLDIISHVRKRKVHFCMYLNLDEAKSISRKPLRSAKEAAKFLLSIGLPNVVITNGTRIGCSARKIKGSVQYNQFQPEKVSVSSTLGAGDVFAAEHILSKILKPEIEESEYLKLASQAAKSFLAEQNLILS